MIKEVIELAVKSPLQQRHVLNVLDSGGDVCIIGKDGAYTAYNRKTHDIRVTVVE